MKKYIKILIPVLIVICSAVYAFVPGAKTLSHQTVQATKAIAAHYQLIDAPDAQNIRQVMTADSTTSRTIMWQSDAPETSSLVEYRIKGTEEALALPADEEAFTDDKTTTYIHTVKLTDLTPDTTYEYRVGYDEKRSAWHTLSTPSGNTFKALIYPDSQSSDYSVWKTTAQAGWKANPDAQFFVNMGDLVDNGEDHTQWNLWFDALDTIIDTIPVAPIMGNHETYNQNWKVRQPVASLNLFTLPSNGQKDYQNQYYSFDYGHVHFVVLNTQIEEMTQFQPHLLETELAWLKQDLSQNKKKWIIVMMHKDVLQYAFQSRPDPRPEGISDTGTIFMPIFDAYNVDVVLTAHLHTYRRRVQLRNFQPDKTGPLYILTGVAGNVRYPDLWKRHAFDEAVAPQPETDNYMTLEASEDQLRFAAYLPSGELLDTATIKK